MLRLNIFANIFNQFLGIGFPLIVQYLIVRTLDINDIGVWNVSISFSTMMVALSGSYYIFQINRIRESKNYHQVSYNVSSGLFFSILLSLPLSIFNYLYIITIFENYSTLAILTSLMTLVCPFSLDYVYQAKQKNHYILYRRLIFRIVAVLLIFYFVQSEKSFNAFVIIMIFSMIGEMLTSFFFARKNFKIKNINISWLKENSDGILGHVLFAATYGISSYLTITILPFFLSGEGLSVISIIMRIIFLATTVISSNSIVLLAYINSGKSDTAMHLKYIGYFSFLTFLGLNIFSEIVFYIFLDEYRIENIKIIFLISTTYIFIHSIYNQIIFNKFVSIDSLRNPIILEIVFLFFYFSMLYFFSEKLSYFTFALALVASRVSTFIMLLVLIKSRKGRFVT